jgi:hypothetical protein
MKAYMPMSAFPWEHFRVRVSGEGETAIYVSGKCDDRNAGFIPLYWTQEAAEAAHPGKPAHEIEIASDWNTSGNEQEPTVVLDRNEVSVSSDNVSVSD